jgi:Asp-tRNA(Asn)/Glu-tRNA(Gln) amidotransferase A subunit family amidase
MKKLFTTICFLLIGFFAFSQEDDGTSMKPVMESMYDVVSTAESNNYEIVRIEFDIIKKNSPKESYRILSTDWTYRVGVFGDNRTEDMDIEIYQFQTDGTYILVGKDSKVDPIAMYDFKPTKTTWYKFVVKCYKFKTGYEGAHYGLLVFHE